MYESNDDENNNNNEINRYKQVEKIYKVQFITHDKNDRVLRKPKRAPLPDMSQVIDFVTLKNYSNESVLNENLSMVEKVEFNSNVPLYESLMNQLCEQFGGDLKLPPLNEWNVYTLKDFPGFYFISQLFTPRQQLYWIEQCLKTYPEPPNLTNLFPFHGLLHNLWDQAQEDPTKYNNYLNKLTWSTLGYQYDWTNRKYHPQEIIPFPTDAELLVQSIACVSGCDEYKPEAAIVNYYNKDKSMGGHKDDAEYAKDKPIVSISYGNDCIFLLGGETKSTAPIPMLIHSGDCMIMGGRSRNCFHGVARVIDDTLPEYLTLEDYKQHCGNESEEHYLPFIKYLNSSTRRLNINARQVFQKSA
jgi:alkylated DNA repair protein alkB family protein 1